MMKKACEVDDDNQQVDDGADNGDYVDNNNNQKVGDGEDDDYYIEENKQQV